MIDAIHELLKHETAGDPIKGVKWTRKTTEKIAEQLRSMEIPVGRTTVARLLKDMDYRLRVNRKSIGAGRDPDRNAQFEYIVARREEASAQGIPLLSVDTKKKEMVGLFKNSGTLWAQEATPVRDHDYRSDAIGMAVPYGIYNVEANRGFVFVGTSSDTPAFAVDCLEAWWRAEGRDRYPHADHLLILADNGGSNGPRCRLWKWALQQQLCDRHGLTITVLHYPPGASKWNPIEHRLFSQMSRNWAGVPLTSYETILKYARTTRTSTGLRVRSRLVDRFYPKGVRVSDDDMAQLNLTRHQILPDWNYTLQPTG